MFTQKPHLGKQIKRLFLHFNQYENGLVKQNTITSMQELLPNIKSVEIIDRKGQYLSHSDSENMLGINSGTWAKLENLHIDEHWYPQISKYLFHSNSYIQLKSLHMSFDSFDCRACNDDLLNVLQHDPQLKTLAWASNSKIVHMDVIDVEKIHPVYLTSRISSFYQE